MGGDSVFREVQRFRQTWLWLIIAISGLITTGIFGAGLYIQVGLGKPFGNHPMSDAGLAAVFGFVALLHILLVLLFLTARLTTRIDREAVIFRFFPFHLREKRITWDRVAACRVIRYNPVGDYGGWGIKVGRKGKAYNVSGDRGVILELKAGGTVLLGTNRPEDLEEFLRARIASFTENDIKKERNG